MDNPAKNETTCLVCTEQVPLEFEEVEVPSFGVLNLRIVHCPTCENRQVDVLRDQEQEREPVKYTLRIPGGSDNEDDKKTTEDDLERMIVKSADASLSFEPLGLEIPPSRYGRYESISKILDETASNLEQNQALRQASAPNQAGKIGTIINVLRSMRAGETAFTICVEDVTGYSFIQPPTSLADGEVDSRVVKYIPDADSQ